MRWRRDRGIVYTEGNEIRAPFTQIERDINTKEKEIRILFTQSTDKNIIHTEGKDTRMLFTQRDKR